MADDPTKTPWYQSNLGAGGIVTVVGGILLLALGPIYRAVAKLPFPLPFEWIVLIVIGGAVLVGSLLSKRMRAALWKPVAAWIWARRIGVNITTPRKRAQQAAAEQNRVEAEARTEAEHAQAIKDAKKEAVRKWSATAKPEFEKGVAAAKSIGVREGHKAGYAERDAEIQAERRRSPQPSWSVSSDRFFDAEGGTFWLNNRGHTVSSVKLTADPEFFDSKAEAFWPDPWSAGTGKFFEGTPTDKGREQGIPFHIEWTDAHGDRQSSPEPVVLRPEDMLPKPTETREEAYQRGRVERQAEFDAERAAPKLVPKWVIQRNAKEGETAHVLVNYEPDAKATNVQLHPPVDRLTIYGNGRWESELDLDPANETRRVGHFLAALKGLGKTHGAMVKITWQDALGDHQEGKAFLDKKPSAPRRATVL